MLYFVLAARSPVRRWIASFVLVGASLFTLPFLPDVCQAQSLVVTPSSLSFTQVADLADPPAQTVQVTASDGSHIPFTIPSPDGTYGSNAGFTFTASPTSGVTPATVTLTVSGGIVPSSPLSFNEFWPVTLNAVVRFIPTPPSPASGASPEVILTLTPPPPPTVTSVVNAINLLPGVSPGELVAITGEYLASPHDAAVLPCFVGPRCQYPERLGNSRVFFNGSPAAFIGYSHPGSLSVIVPYGITGPSVQMVLQHFSQSTTITLPLLETSPAICRPSPRPVYDTLDPRDLCCPPFASGYCSPGMFLNADYSVNGPANPAPIGSAVLFIANGSGNWNHLGPNGAWFLFADAVPLAPVSVTIGGQPAPIQYAKSGLANNIAVTYNLQVSAVVPPGIAPGPQPVVLTVGSASNLPQQVTVEVQDPQPPKIAGVVNAASFQSPLSPGEYVSIFGQSLAPPAAAQVLYNVGIPPASTTVTFNGAYTVQLFTDIGQINAIVPYQVAGQSDVSVVVTHYGQSEPFTVAVADTSPAIFALDGSGSGQGAILNVDNTVNSAKQPAAAGSVIQMWATGAGLWNPPASLLTRVSLQPPFPVPVAPVSLTIGGIPAQILYAGAAPGFFAGLLQVNAVVPAGLASGPQPLVLKIGENTNAPQQVTVAVQ